MNYHLSIYRSIIDVYHLSIIDLSDLSSTCKHVLYPPKGYSLVKIGTWNTIFLSSPAHVSSRPRDSRSRPGPPSSSVLGTPGLVGEEVPTPNPVPLLKLRPGLFHSWHSVQTCFCLSLSVFFSFSRELCENV